MQVSRSQVHASVEAVVQRESRGWPPASQCCEVWRPRASKGGRPFLGSLACPRLSGLAVF